MAFVFSLWKGESPNRPFCAAIAGTFGALTGLYLGLAGLVFLGFGFMIVAAMWGERLGQPIVRLIGLPLVMLLLKMSGKLPILLKRFLDYSCGALLLKESSNHYGFIHRQLRDFFALNDIVPLLESQTDESRLDVVRELVNIKDASCDVLFELIEDQDKAVRIESIKGLGIIGSHAAAKVLVEIISATGEGLQKEAISALKYIKDVAAVPLLKGVVSGGNLPLYWFSVKWTNAFHD